MVAVVVDFVFVVVVSVVVDVVNTNSEMSEDRKKDEGNCEEAHIRKVMRWLRQKTGRVFSK